MAWFGSKDKLAAPPPLTLAGDTLPPDASRARSEATAAALAAAARQRKKAGVGATLLTGLPLGGGINPPAVLKPKSLVGY